jgi:chromosome segregation ATPase
MRWNNRDIEKAMEKLTEKIEELPFPEDHEKKAELRGILEKLQKGIDDLEEEANDLDDEKEDLEDKVEELEREVDELEGDLAICNRDSDPRGGLNYSESELNRMLLEIWTNRFHFAYDKEKMKLIESISKM